MSISFFLFVCVRGVGPGCNTREIADKLIDLKLELEDLDRREHELDQQRVWVQQSIKNVTDDSLNSPYPSSRYIGLSVGQMCKSLFMFRHLGCLFGNLFK